jgi:glycosyltransferase involved in cell wall biosynthesis
VVSRTDLPKITIITPSFRQARFLERTIRSVFDQKYPHLEYLVIDGGSDDGSVEIIRKYADRLTYWVSERDRGQSHAINKGLERASGTVINWLNSDDWLEPGALHKIGEAFRDPSVNVLCGFSRLHQNGRQHLKQTSGHEGTFERTVALGHIVQPSTFFRKSVLDEFRPVSEKLHFMMDHYLWLQYLMKYQSFGMNFRDDVYANVECHDDAKSVKDIVRFADDRALIFHSLFRARGLFLRDKSTPRSELLRFHQVTYDLPLHREEINFQYLTQQLFQRDAEGRRIGTDLGVLRCLLRNYPVRTVARFALRHQRAPTSSSGLGP